MTAMLLEPVRLNLLKFEATRCISLAPSRPTFELMAPSRGCRIFFNNTQTLQRRQTASFLKSRANSYSTHPASSLPQLASDPAAKHQIYISRSNDPYLNLSIEHFLLQKTPADSTVLFLYTNRPSIVIGRNQNPWLEVNLRLLNAANQAGSSEHRTLALGDVLLVRRRSGGGTVFHDEGNVNYCVICPTGDFTRDKHAEMVVRALRRWSEQGINARVNERHDIMLDQGSWDQVDPEARIERSDTHRSLFQEQGAGPPLKISGSAYKLTRLRALHHGTCLLASPNLGGLHAYLDSPARPFMKARGVESVRSPVGNLCADHKHFRTAFETSVVSEFGEMHGMESSTISHIARKARESDELYLDEGLLFGRLSSIHEEWADIGKGLAELKVWCFIVLIVTTLTAVCAQSPEWTYNQTPQFILSSHPCVEDPRERPALPLTIPPSVCLPICFLNQQNAPISS